MAKSNLIIGMLVTLLLATNAWWGYNAIDAGVTNSYARVSLDDNRQALAQSLAVIEASARPGATKKSIILAAQIAGGSSEPFEKDGYVWVSSIGLKFDPSGRLISASRSWSPP